MSEKGFMQLRHHHQPWLRTQDRLGSWIYIVDSDHVVETTFQQFPIFPFSDVQLEHELKLLTCICMI